jgi:hypothetical protein
MSDLRYVPIEDLEKVSSLIARCNECMDEEFAEDDCHGARQSFCDKLRKAGWLQTGKFGLLCKDCAKELQVVAP